MNTSSPIVQKVCAGPTPAGFDFLTLASIVATVAGYLIDCYKKSKEPETPKQIVAEAYFEGEYRPRLLASVARRIAIAERQAGKGRLNRAERRTLAVKVLDAIREGDEESVDQAIKEHDGV